MNLTKGGIMFNQREIVLIPFPYSDLTGFKKRPALILSNSKLNKTEDRICCLITSQKTNQGILINKKFIEEGTLPFKSWIKPQRIFTIDQNIIIKKLCKVNKKIHTAILSELNSYLKDVK